MSAFAGRASISAGILITSSSSRRRVTAALRRSGSLKGLEVAERLDLLLASVFKPTIFNEPVRNLPFERLCGKRYPVVLARNKGMHHHIAGAQKIVNVYVRAIDAIGLIGCRMLGGHDGTSS